MPKAKRAKPVEIAAPASPDSSEGIDAREASEAGGRAQGAARGEATPITSEPAAASGTGERRSPVPRERLKGAVEAILISLDKPIASARIAEAISGGVPGKGPGRGPGAFAGADVDQAIEALNEEYDRTERAFRIERVAGGWRVMTRPEQADAVGAFHASRAAAKLSRAAVETLAIIAYRQPVARAELEAIRGVACGEVLRSLLERRLVSIVGRAEELGRPLLYGTSKRFLEVFGLASVKDLPAIGDFLARAAEASDAPAGHAQTDASAAAEASPTAE